MELMKPEAYYSKKKQEFIEAQKHMAIPDAEFDKSMETEYGKRFAKNASDPEILKEIWKEYGVGEWKDEYCGMGTVIQMPTKKKLVASKEIDNSPLMED